MSTVLVDRYRAVCSNCGFDSEFMVGAGRGDFFAVKDAESLHKREGRQCDSDLHLTVTKVEVGAMTPDALLTDAREWLDGSIGDGPTSRLIRALLARCAQEEQTMTTAADDPAHREGYKSLKAEIRRLRTALAEVRQERDDWKGRYEDEYAIVDRVWKALGVTFYEQAGGKSIDELIADLQRALAEARKWRADHEHILGLAADDAAMLRARLAEVRQVNTRLVARCGVAEQHKVLDRLGRSSYQEVVEDRLRTELAEAQLALTAATAQREALRGYLAHRSTCALSRAVEIAGPGAGLMEICSCGLAALLAETPQAEKEEREKNLARVDARGDSTDSRTAAGHEVVSTTDRKEPASACAHSSPACADCQERFDFRVRRAEKEMRKLDTSPAVDAVAGKDKVL